MRREESAGFQKTLAIYPGKGEAGEGVYHLSPSQPGLTDRHWPQER